MGQRVATKDGYVVQDPSDLTLADFNDAVGGHDRAVHESCSNVFEGWFCTREIHHTGPHVCATGPDAITALWEEGVGI